MKTHFGPRQRQMLRNMYVYRDDNYQCWGDTWDRRRILEPLVRRGLVEMHETGQRLNDREYRLTDLGEQAAVLLIREEEGNKSIVICG